MWLVVLLAGVGAWSYWGTIDRIVEAWASDPDYSHGFLVPLICGWLLWIRRGSAPPSRSTTTDVVGAIGVIGLAAALRCLAARVYLPEIDAATIPLWIGGVVWLAAGRRVAAWALPAIAFLLFALPLPATLETAFSTPLQLLAADASGALLRCLGQPAVTEGATILLGYETFEVERACSGLRMFFGITGLAVAIVIARRPQPWQSVLLLAAAPVVAVGANVVRITLTALAQTSTGSESLRQLAHDYSALCLLPVAAATILLLLTLLQSLGDVMTGASRLRRGWLLVGAAGAVLIGLGVFRAAENGHAQAADILLATAEELYAAGERRESIETLRRYTLLREDDATTMELVADRLWEFDTTTAGSRRAFPYYERAWRLDQSDDDLGLKTLQAAFSAGLYPKAVEIAGGVTRRLGAESPVADQVIKLRADAVMALATNRPRAKRLTADEAEALRLAVSRPLPEVRHARALAMDLEARSTATPLDPLAVEAELLLDRLVEARPNEPAAWIARHRYYYRRSEKLPEAQSNAARTAAQSDLSTAIGLADTSGGPGAAEAYLVGAQRARESGDLAEPERLFRLAIDANPRDHRGYLLLAELLRQPGDRRDLERAAELLDEGASALGRIEIALLIRLATLRAELDEPDQATDALEPVIQALPQVPEPSRRQIQLAVDLVHARMTRKREGHAAAAASLAAAIRRATRQGGEGLPATLLGRAYDRLGRLQAAAGSHAMSVQSLLVARTLIALRPDSTRLLANAAALSDDFDLAETTYRQLLVASPGDPALRAALLGVTIRRRITNPTGPQSWEDLLRRLDNAVAIGMEPATASLLRGEVLVGQGRPADAVAAVVSALGLEPDNPSLWRGLAGFRQRAGDDEGAIEAANRYRELTGDTPSAVKLLARLLILQDRAEEAALLVEDTLVGDSKTPVNAAIMLADIALRRARTPEAFAILQRAAEEHPDELLPVRLLAQLAVAEADWRRLPNVLDRLREIEGEQGVYWRLYGAEQRLAAAKSADDPLLIETSRLADQLLELRPNWPESHFLQAEVQRRLGNSTAALRHYSEAWRRGKRDARTADGLLATLSNQRRFTRAATVTAEIAELVATSPRLFDRVTSISTELVSSERLVDVARGWVRSRPESASARLRLARSLLMAAETQAAENEGVSPEVIAELQEAVRLDPENSNTWVNALLLLRGGVRGADRLEESLRRLTEVAPLSDSLRPIVLARALAATGARRDAAKRFNESWRAALRSPDEKGAAEVLAAAADFFVGDSPYLAERLAYRAMSLDARSVGARLAFARAVAAGTGDADPGLAALEAAEPNTTSAGAAATLLRGQLLRRRAGPGDLGDAIALVNNGLGESTTKELLLARLDEDRGDLSTAADRLSLLVDAETGTAEQHEAFVAFWQRHFMDEDDPAYARRVQIAYDAIADSPGGPARWLRWRLREHQSEVSESRDQALVEVIDEACRLASADEPGAVAALLRVCLEEGMASAALRFVANPPVELSPEDTLTGLLHALVRGKPIRLDSENERLLTELVSAGTGEADVQQSAGDYALLTGRYQLASERYEAAIELAPDRPDLCNNLALAYGEMADRAADALRWVAEAEARGGDAAEMEDSRAWLALRAGRADDALIRLESLASHSPGPAIRLHHAMALRAVGRDDDATEELLAALGLGVERRPLLPREREFLDEMKAEIVESETEDPEGVSAQLTLKTLGDAL